MNLKNDFHNMIDLIDPVDMEYYLQNSSPRTVPICIAAAVYRISAGNCMPNTNNQKRSFLSPWESYRRKKAEDTSSLESTCSSRSDSPEPKSNKKRSTHLLLREIHRLRGENTALRNSVSLLKNDLRDITLARQDTDASHRRFYEEYLDKNAQLEIDVMDRDDEIARLKKEIEQLKSRNTNYDTAYEKNGFGCFEFHDDEGELSCQPVAHESALPEVDIKMDELKTEDEHIDDYFHKRYMDDLNPHYFSQQSEEEEEEEEEEEPFENVASSYIQQAMLSRLSSARVRLEFDDLICKYEPSSDTITTCLADAFVTWMGSLITNNNKTSQPISIPKVFTSKIQAGIVEFWESILQYYMTDDQAQRQLLDQIEHVLQTVPFGLAIADHFDRLVLMLYKYHVIDDDALISWWQTASFDHPISQKIRKVTTRFIEWVQDSEEEEEEEEEEDDDDDDESDVFSFVESPLPEEEEEEDLNSSIDDLLNTNTRNYCVCHDTNNNSSECTCSTYTPPQVPEKKKKSVRIAM